MSITDYCAPVVSSVLNNYAQILGQAVNIPSGDQILTVGAGLLILLVFVLFAWILAGLTLTFTGQKYPKEYHFSLTYICGLFIPALAAIFLPFTRNVVIMPIFLIASVVVIYKLFQAYPSLPNMFISAIAGSFITMALVTLAVLNAGSLEDLKIVLAAPVLVCLGAGFNVFLCRRNERVVVMISTIVVGCTMCSPLLPLFTSITVPQSYFLFAVAGLISQCHQGNHVEKKAKVVPVVDIERQTPRPALSAGTAAPVLVVHN